MRILKGSASQLKASMETAKSVVSICDGMTKTGKDRKRVIASLQGELLADSGPELEKQLLSDAGKVHGLKDEDIIALDADGKPVYRGHFRLGTVSGIVAFLTETAETETETETAADKMNHRGRRVGV